MNRRQFIRIGSAATSLAAAMPSTVLMGDATRVEIVHATAVPASVHVLGQSPSGQTSRLIKGLSDEVFVRLIGAFRRRRPRDVVRLVSGSRPGDAYADGTLQWQWNTSYKVPLSFTNDAPPYFPIDHFWWATDRWIGGSVCCPRPPVYGFWQPVDDHADPFAIFDALRVAGMPYVPSGLPWAAHYVDKDTGLVMRALGSLDIYTDELVCRWDVIGG